MISCEPESTVPDQNKIYTSYVFNYNASLNKTTAEVAFYLGDPNGNSTTKLELKQPSKVTFNDEDLLFNVNDRCYRKEFLTLSPGTFKYTNHDGVNFMNTVDLTDTVAVIFSSDSANADVNYHFEITGTPLQENELIEVYAHSLESDFELSATFSSIGFTPVQISSSELSALGAGETIFRITRKTVSTDNVQTPQIGGEVSSEYAVQDTIVIY